MPGTVSHILSATTPDNPAYEIRPSAWNSVHAVTLNAVGSEISGAFSNQGNVSFGLNGGGFVTASANVTAAPSPVNVTGANGSSVNAQTIAFSNSNGMTLGLSTAANGATVTGSYTVPSVPTAYVSSVNGSSGAISLNAGSSLSASSNGSSITFGLATDITTALQPAGAYLTTAAQSNHSHGFSAAGGSSAFQTLSFSNGGGVSFTNTNGQVGASVETSYAGSNHSHGFSAAGGSSAFQTLAFSNGGGVSFTNTNGQVGASVATTYAGSNHSHGNPTLNLTNLSGTTASNSAGFTLSLSANSPTSNFSAGVSGGNTSGDTGATGTRVVFAGGNNITLSQATNANGATITVSGANIGGAQTGISGVQVSDTTYSSGTVTFRNANGISFGSSGAQGISASYTVPTVTNSSWTVSDAASSATVGRLAFTNLNGVTLSLSTGAAGSHTIVGSHNALTSQSNQNVTAANGGFAFQTLSFSNANAFSFGTSAGSAITGSYTVPSVTQYFSATNTTFNGTNVSGSLTINTAGLRVDLSGNAAFSAGVSGGNTSGDTGATGTRVVFAGGNNITLSQATNANGATITVSGANVGGAQTGISGIQVSDTTYTSGTVTFRNANGISFGSSGAQGISASYTVPTITSLSVSDAATSGTLARLAFTNLNGVTLSLSTGAGGSHTIVGSHNALTSQSNQNITAANGGFAFQTLSFSNTNGVSFITSAGSAIAASVVTSYRASNDALGLNTAQTNVTWTVNSSGVSLNAGGYAGTATGFTGANISGSMTHNTAGLSLSLSANAPGAATLTVSAVGNTTVNSSGTWPNAVSVRAYGVLSVGTSNGSLLFSTPDPVDFTQLSVGNSNVGNTAGDTGVFTGRVVFVGSNNITLSGSSNAGSQTISIIGGGAGGAANFNLLGANTSGNTTATGATIGLSGLNVTLSGTNNSVIVISAPATSSIVGTSGISISSNGSTFSVFPQALSDWSNAGEVTQAATVQANSLVSIVPLRIEWPVVASNVLVGASVAVTSAANNSTAYVDVSVSGVMYTRNASTLSSLFSFSNSYTQTWSSNATATVGAPAMFSATFAGSTLTPGNYWMALHVSTNNTATGGANTTALGNAVSMILARVIGSGVQGIRHFGGASANSLGLNSGQGIISTNATRASIAFSDYTVTGTRAVLAGVAVLLRNQTYQ